MPTNNFDDYLDKLKKVKLDPSRKNLKPRPSGLTDEQYLTLAIKEGHELLGADSVKPTPSVKESNSELQSALAKMSTNPYARAQAELLDKLPPKARSVMEDMINNAIPRDDRYDKFMRQVISIGNKLSGNN